jgi:hypothetical protein
LGFVHGPGPYLASLDPLLRCPNCGCH